MGLFDLIGELRSGEPSPKKAARGLKILGWVCFGGGLWNFILPRTAPFHESGFPLPPYFEWVALISFSILGAMFLLASRGVLEMRPWGKRLGQVAIVVLVGGMILFFFNMFSEFFPATGGDGFSRIFVYVVFAIGMAQFGVPAYFGVLYLGRLPTRGPFDSAGYQDTQEYERLLAERMEERTSERPVGIKYKNSPSPFGVIGTFVLILGGTMLAVIAGEKFLGEGVLMVILPIMFALFFLGTPLFNLMLSPFEKDRVLLKAYIGGGSIYLFNGSWPFFRLMVYADALEVRVMFHRFLIPYGEMEDIGDKVGFFSSGLLIKSDLPGVPSRIRFSGFGMKKIVKFVYETRKAFLEGHSLKVGAGEGGRP